MSSYINFYLHGKTEFLPIGSFSRNSEIYQAFVNYVPYEKGTPITYDILNSVCGDIDSDLNSLTTSRKDEEDLAQRISSFNNSVEDKLAQLVEVRDTIKSIEENIEELRSAKEFAHWLKGFIGEAEYTKYYSDLSLHLDPATYVWAGVEWNPAFDDDDDDEDEN